MITILNLSAHVVLFIISFIISMIAGPFFIPILTRLKFGQVVRDDGPQTHFYKMGTPTMGGIIFLLPVLLCSFFYIKIDSRILALLLVTLGFGAVGFIDDFIKIVKKRKDGLYPKQKMLALIIVATAFAFYVAMKGIGTDIIIPFFNTQVTFDLAWLFIPFSICVLISSTNAVNITDGLDGLAAGVTLIVLIFFTLVSSTGIDWEYIQVFSAILGGGCLGFLAYNSYPAKVFMGDTGSLALGGAIGAIAILMKMPLVLVIVGFIYVIETLSVVLQVASFKLRGKRIFKMAPLHHHFELLGWKETKVVTLFMATTFVLCILGFVAVRYYVF